MSNRTREFKIATYHGKLNPTNSNSEAKLRNDLYLIGTLSLNFSRAKVVSVRLIGYEVPLIHGQKRGNCIDLLGYDSEHNPYIIELKMANSKDKLNKVIDQINSYEQLLVTSLPYIEQEYQAKLHIPEFKFTERIKKIILAPREYYAANPICSDTCKDILFCSFFRVADDKDFLSKRASHSDIGLKIENK